MAKDPVDPAIEREYWSKTFEDRPYYKDGPEYAGYELAYRLGWESAERTEYAGKQFEDVEPELEKNWTSSSGPTDPWTDARDATHDAWLRVRSD